MTLTFGQMFAATSLFKAGMASYGATAAATTELSYYHHIIQNAQNNQILTMAEIRNAEKRGRAEENANRLRYKHMKASQKAGWGSRNILMTGGTPLDILLSTNVIEAVDREAIAANTDNEVFGLNIKKFNYKNEADIASAKASSISPSRAGSMAFMSSLLSSAGDYAGYKYSKIG
ncbi:MAG: hypothetical protein CMM33_08420 [Rhodospirillaceae bacterium]|nr:hypothetical protein [Rhodospirillaceae bacterium]